MKQTNKNSGKQKELFLVATVTAIIFLMAIILFVFLNHRKQNATTQNTASSNKEATTEYTPVSSGGSFSIPVSEISETVTFYPLIVDDTKMEIMAVKDYAGTIRTAFNTCQSCYGSGQAYYEQKGDILECQNCGNHFTIEQVGIESNGCNPWPIFEENKTVTDDSITISYDFLSQTKDIFANWKTNY